MMVFKWVWKKTMLETSRDLPNAESPLTATGALSITVRSQCSYHTDAAQFFFKLIWNSCITKK